MSFPALGFGTAPILGRLSRRDSLRALEKAYELGVRHFDTARSYGWGEAEGVLGEFLADRPRGDVTLVTKCGILPQRRSSLLSASKAAARAMIKILPVSRRLVMRAASAPAFQPAYSYDVTVLRESVATSLNELRTPYVDVLLLHDYAPDQQGVEDVIELFRRLVQEGKARRYGFSVEGELLPALEHLEARGVLAEAVIQTPVTPELFAVAPSWRNVAIIAHSPFRAMAAWPETDGVCGLRGVLRALSHGCRCQAVVASMFTPAHIEVNVRDHALEAAWDAANTI